MSFVELSDFLVVLDKRTDQLRQKMKHHTAVRKPRRQGEAATSEPPENAPQWALNKDWRKGMQYTCVLS